MAKPQLLNAFVAELEETKPVRIRPELNLDRWCLWSPSSSRVVKPRLFEPEIRLASGLIVKGSLEIQPRVRFLTTGEKKELQRKRKPDAKGKLPDTITETLTTFDQRVYYALTKVWEEKGESITYTYLSLRRLARELGLVWGTQTLTQLRLSLSRLRAVALSWNSSFINPEKKAEIETLEIFNILSDVKLITRKEHGHITREEGYFQFNPLIVRNLRANHRRPVLFNVILSFKSEVAQMIYTQLDRILSETNRYERRTKELFTDLGLEGSAYKHVANRKQILERAVTELQGKALSKGGIIAKAEIVPTVDNRDCKVVFVKGSSAKKPPALKPTPSQEKELVTRLYEELGISLTVARTLEASHPDRSHNWCDAKKYSHEMKDKGAGFFVRAIMEGWELPTDYKEIKARSDRRAAEEKEQKINQAKEAHWERCSKEYLAFAARELERINQENPDAFRKFEEGTAEERKNYERFGLTETRILEARVIYADWFFNDGYWANYKIPFIGFWEWDEKHNPNSFRFEDEASR